MGSGWDAGFRLGGDSVSFATKDGKFVFVLSLRRRRPENIIRHAGRDPTIRFEEDLLCFRLETLNYGLELEYQGFAVR